MKRYLILLFLIAATPCFARIHILGYSRSGTHYLCYSLTKLLHKPIITVPLSETPRVRMIEDGQSISYQIPVRNFSAEQLEGAMWFNHNPGGMALHKVDQSENYLVVIVRDYHECVMSNVMRYKQGEGFSPDKVFNSPSHWKSVDEISDPLSYVGSDYINVLRCYDEWDPSTRILIYYEDLIDDFEGVMTMCLEKLGGNLDELEVFVNNLLEEQQQSGQIYQRHGGVISKGDTKYYQKQYLGREYSRRWDHDVETKYPYFWQKYLSRYKVDW